MSNDPHALYVAELQADADWAGLLRYGLAHGLHMPAVDAAIDVLHSRHFGTGFAVLRTWLTEFRDSPLQPREPCDTESLDLPQAEQIALTLVQTWPFVALCEMAGQFPPDQQTQLFQMGQQTAELWLKLSEVTDDAALAATAHSFLANSHDELRNLESAVASFEEALTIRRKLAAARPDVYLPNVTATLNNLGTV
ncbi:MAG: hypothetical protein KDA89_02845, partial [Planctomycetaceae bacterium]|nr:hypothetical protein [Planctomycetaceae bacterium]